MYVTNIGFPKYINDVLHISIEKNSSYAAWSRFLHTTTIILSGFISDWMFTKRKISLTGVRKTFVVLGMCYQMMELINIINDNY